MNYDECNSAAAGEQLPDPGADEESAQKSLLRKFWDSFNFIIIPVVAVVLLLRVFFSLAYVPTSSMETTLPTRSYFFGLRLPYLLSDPVPRRGDIIMFRSDELDEILVKRVVGLPGETITFQDGYVLIDDVVMEESYLPENGITYAAGEWQDTFTVPEGCVFVMGDNRTDSWDSRFWNDPYVSVSKIRSKALVDLAFFPQCSRKGVFLLT